MAFSPITMNPPNTLQLPSTSAQKQFIYHTFELYNVQMSQTLDRYTLTMNPTDYQMTEQARTALTNTLGGAYIDKYGRAIPQVTIQGTMGYRARMSWEGSLLDGFTAFLRLRNDIYRNFLDSTDPNLELRWYNWPDAEYYAIMPKPDGFTLQQSAQEPLLYRYNFSFWCIKPLVSVNESNLIPAAGASIQAGLSNIAASLRTGAGVTGYF